MISILFVLAFLTRIACQPAEEPGDWVLRNGAEDFLGETRVLLALLEGESVFRAEEF